MTPASAIDPATVLAYEHTEYRVFGTVPAVLLVGMRCAPLAILHERYRTTCSAFITACNPLGRILKDAANAALQQALRMKLARAGWVTLEGLGQHPTGSWPGEPSFLVLGMPRAIAEETGRHFQQNAIVWAGADAIPQLILLR